MGSELEQKIDHFKKVRNAYLGATIALSIASVTSLMLPKEMVMPGDSYNIIREYEQMEAQEDSIKTSIEEKLKFNPMGDLSEEQLKLGDLEKKKYQFGERFHIGCQYKIERTAKDSKWLTGAYLGVLDLISAFGFGLYQSLLSTQKNKKI